MAAKKRIASIAPPALTKLSPGQEIAYQKWMNQIGHTMENGYDVDKEYNGKGYDYRGYWKDVASLGLTSYQDGVHLPDTYKTHAPFREYNTLSDESKYASQFDKRGQHTYLKDAKGDYIFDELTGQDKLSAYGKGTKMVEVEGDEVAFEKKGRKFKLKADFKGGPSHKEGGIPYLATEGEVIFPKQQRKKILDLYTQGNDTQLEKYRKKLPKDTPKLANGTGGITPALREQLKYRTPDNLTDPGLLDQSMLSPVPSGRQITDPNGHTYKVDNGNYFYQPKGTTGWQQQKSEQSKNAIEALFNPLKPDPYSGGEPANPFPASPSMANPLTIDQLMSGSGQSQGMLMQSSTQSANAEIPGAKTGKMGNLANNIGMYGNAAYNLFKGLGPAEKVERNYINPQLLSYQDSSAPDRRNSISARNITRSNARNLSGGNASRVQSSLQQAENENLDRQSTINNTEYGRAQAITNANTEIKNQTNQANLSLRNSYNDVDMRSSAAKRGFLGAAVNEVTGQAKQNLVDQASKDADGKKLNFYDSLFSNYKVKRDANGNPVGIEMKK